MRALRLLVACVLPAVAHAASAVAVLLTTKPSGKSDGWNPRSVKAADSSNACAAGVSLCAVLVLRDTVRRFGNVPDADFVAMVDAPCPEPLRSSLEANAIVAEEMDFGTYGKLFGDYLLMRKFYVLKMTRYDKVLLLDTDTIVVGSLRHLLADETKYRCGAALARDPAEHERCWPETDAGICETDVAIAAQQTAGTPILTAFMVALPSIGRWRAFAADLERACGGGAVCNKKRVYHLGWDANATTPAPERVSEPRKDFGPHAWAMRRRPGDGRKRMRLTQSPWDQMGAGFTDQGFAEYHFSLKTKSVYSLSHRTCKLKYVHFNMPPKPWFCPGRHCKRHEAYREGDPVDLRWGGHKCAKDWWWQYVASRPALAAPPKSCAAKCLGLLDRLQRERGAFADPAMANYTPACKDWNPRWPPLDPSLRPPDAFRASLFAPA